MRTRMLAIGLVLMSVVGFTKEEAQPFPVNETGKVVFQGVVQVEGATKAQIYSKAKLWAAKAFKSAKDVIQLDDPENGTLVLKGLHHEVFGGTADFYLRFSVTIEVKDGRFRWTIDQLAEGIDGIWPIEKSLNKDHVGGFSRKAVYERCRKAMMDLAASLEEAIKAPISKGPDF